MNSSTLGKKSKFCGISYRLGKFQLEKLSCNLFLKYGVLAYASTKNTIKDFLDKKEAIEK